MRAAPQVNAGSMADIAFLLLIFFLVTTTMAKDEGINRKLPRNCPPGQICTIDIHERNILRIVLNSKQEIMVEDDLVAITNLKYIAKTFLDNNGDNSCNYCKGNSLTTSSDNPTKAIISLQTGKQTSYELFIALQDELTKAYYELRETYAVQRLGKDIDELSKKDFVNIRNAYPFILSEAETK
jgi:biopolymer transport protein ExbD